MPDTLVDYYTTRLEALDVALARIFAAIESSRERLNDEKTTAGFFVARSDGLAARIATLRGAPAGAGTPADIEDAARTLRALEIEERACLARLETASLNAAIADKDIESLLERQQSLAKERDAAASELTVSMEQAEKHQAFIDALAEAPLNTVVDGATALLNADGLIPASRSALNAAIHEGLLDIVKKRISQHWNRNDGYDGDAAALISAWDSRHEAQYGQGGKLDIAFRAYELASSELGEFVANAPASVESATALATAAGGDNPLSVAQKARVDQLLGAPDAADILNVESEFLDVEHALRANEQGLQSTRARVHALDPTLDEAGLVAHADVAPIVELLDGDGAPGLREQHTDALNATGRTSYATMLAREADLNSARSDLEQAVKAFLEAHPEDNPEAAAELNDEREEVVTATNALTLARQAMEQTPWYRLEQIEVAIPDSAWNLIHRLFEAERRVAEIRDTVTADLVSNLSDAEHALVTAIRESDNTETGGAILGLRIGQLDQAADQAAGNAAATDLNRVRGLD